MPTTKGQLYFTTIPARGNTATQPESLEIQYVPYELEISRLPNVEDVAIIGRNNPLYQFTSGATKLNFELDFHSEEEGKEDVIRKCKWVESLTYKDGDINPPTLVRLTFGRLFQRNEMWVVKACTYKISLFDAENGFLPRQAYMQLVLELNTRKNLNVSDVQWKR